MVQTDLLLIVKFYNSNRYSTIRNISPVIRIPSLLVVYQSLIWFSSILIHNTNTYTI